MLPVLISIGSYQAHERCLAAVSQNLPFHQVIVLKYGSVATRKKNSECRLCYFIIAADLYMSLMLCCACPPSLNIVSLLSTVVDHCTKRYGTGRVVGTVSYTRTATVDCRFYYPLIKSFNKLLSFILYIFSKLFSTVQVDRNTSRSSSLRG